MRLIKTVYKIEEDVEEENFYMDVEYYDEPSVIHSIIMHIKSLSKSLPGMNKNIRGSND